MPAITTLRVSFCLAAEGATLEMVAALAVTEKEFGLFETVWAPDVIEKPRNPVAAKMLAVRLMVALVGPLTVTELTTMPEPKLAVVEPATHVVNWPVTLITLLASPCVMVPGLISVMAGVPNTTPNAEVTTSPPVEMVTVRLPIAAAESIVMLAVTSVGLKT